MTAGVGCTCGWPLDPCNSSFATGSCGKEAHEREMGYREVECLDCDGAGCEKCGGTGKRQLRREGE